MGFRVVKFSDEELLKLIHEHWGSCVYAVQYVPDRITDEEKGEKPFALFSLSIDAEAFAKEENIANPNYTAEVVEYEL